MAKINSLGVATTGVQYFNGTTLYSGITGTIDLPLVSTGVGTAPSYQVLTPAGGGTGTSTVFTTGSIIFAGASGVFSQDNANLFWNDSTNRLGIGTNSPSTSSMVTINSSQPRSLVFTGIKTAVSATGFLASLSSVEDLTSDTNGSGVYGYHANISFGAAAAITTPIAASFLSSPNYNTNAGTVSIAAGFYASSGGGTVGTVTAAYGGFFEAPLAGTSKTALYATNLALGSYTGITPPTNGMIVSGSVAIGASSATASALLALTSTTQGFLPPVMNTTQRNAITPATGLTIYNSTNLDLETYNGSIWVGASGSGVTSITGTANQINASASTGAVTLSLSSTLVAPGTVVSTSDVAIGNSIFAASRLRITPTTTNSYNILMDGGMSLDDGNAIIGIYNILSLAPTNNNKSVYGAFFGASCSPVSTNTITLATSADFSMTGTIGSGTVTAAYSGRFFDPTIGTARTALYSDNIEIGFSGITPPTNGLQVSGVSSFGTSDYLVDTALPVQLNATSSNERYFAVNKANSYAALFGFINGTALGTGVMIRCVTTDPILFFVNGTTEAGRWLSTGELLINTTTASTTAPLTVNGFSGGGTANFYNATSNAGLTVLQSSNASNTSPSALVLRHTRGTIASPTATQSGDWLGAINLGGYTNALHNPGIVILGTATETWSATGAGSQVDFFVTNNTTITNALSLTLSSEGSVVCGGDDGAALSTTATDGFLYIPSCNGTPTGVPTAFTGRNAVVYDTSANKIWIYNGSWRGVVVT